MPSLTFPAGYTPGIGAVADELVMLPVDGGNTLVAGIEGVFLSLPEDVRRADRRAPDTPPSP